MTRPLRPSFDQRIAINAARGRLRNLERRSAGPWVYVGTHPTDADTRPESPPYQNGWGPEGGGAQRPRFRWLLGGGVEIQGCFAGGAYGTVAFTLPAGYIPDDGSLFLAGTDAENNVIVFQIDPGTGDVTIVGPGTATATIGTGSVTTVELADGSVTTAKIANLAVTSAKLADGAVTPTKIAAGAVGTVAIADGAVTGAKLEDDGVTAGTYGDASHVAEVTVDAKGRATTVVATAIQIAESAVTGLVADLASLSASIAAKISSSLFTAKGDILVATAADTPTALPAGTDGQVLTSRSTAPHGVDWEDPTGGGGSTSPLTTKGDLWGFDTADDRIPVGADGQVLTARSSAPLGVDWETPAAGSAGLGTYGLLVEDGATAPPVTLYSEDGTDWLYADG